MKTNDTWERWVGQQSVTHFCDLCECDGDRWSELVKYATWSVEHFNATNSPDDVALELLDYIHGQGVWLDVQPATA